MQTRSAARKAAPEVAMRDGDGAYIQTTPSATGKGIHSRRVYPNTPSSPTPAGRSTDNEAASGTAKPLDALHDDSTESFSSLFEGPLSPITSDGSSDGSLSLSSLSSSNPSSSNLIAGPSMFDNHHQIQDFRAPGTNAPNNTPNGSFNRLAQPTASDTSVGNVGPARTPRKLSRPSPLSRPLQRSSVQRWRRDVNGELVPVTDDELPIIRRTNANERTFAVFERELAKINESKELVESSMQALDTPSDDEKDMEVDAVSMFHSARPILGPSSQPVASGSGANHPAGARPLGPHGTELIDDSFRAEPGESGVYPNEWVKNRSNRLRSFPTETWEMNTSSEL